MGSAHEEEEQRAQDFSHLHEIQRLGHKTVVKFRATINIHIVVLMSLEQKNRCVANFRILYMTISTRTAF